MTPNDTRPPLDPLLTIDIVDSIRRGNRHAFDDLFRRVGEKVYVYIHNRMGARLQKVTDAEDVLQEVYTRAYESFDEFVDGGSGSMAGWLIGIAKNQIRKLYKHHFAYEKRTPDRAVPLDAPNTEGMAPRLPAAGDPTPSRVIARSEDVRRLAAALASLPDDERELILENVYEERSIRDIASDTGITHTTLAYRLTKALRALRAELGEA